MKYRLLLPIFLLCPTALLQGETLREALCVTLAKHPQVQSSKAEIAASRHSYIATRGAYFPQAKVSASIYRQQERIYSSTSKYMQNSSNVEGTASVDQMLFDGFETRYRVKFSKERISASQYSLCETQESLSLGLLNAYLNVLRYRKLIQLSEENIETHKDILRKIKLKYERGASNKADLDLTIGRLSSAESTFQLNKQALEQAEADYIFFTGHSPEELTLPALNKDSEEYFHSLSIMQNPTLQVARKQVSTSEALKKASRGPLYPRFDVRFTSRDSEEIKKSDFHKREYRVEGIMSFDLFKGGSDIAKYRENRALNRKAHKDLQNTYLSLIKEKEATFDRYLASRERVGYFQNYVESMKSVVKAYEGQFKLGKRNLLNLLDVKNELFNAESSLENESYNLLESKYRMMFISGDLVKEILTESLPGQKRFPGKAARST